uniref:Pentatricopeptide repeat-containing protein At1g77405 n=1 Tax=Nelumbo nucifera TaxID=4432 RepID=A0A822ZDM2_NELNU|nr:TPA_asm: hypothetical protein HUJ06_000840 [Nelumbo nucifera]
MLVSSSFLRISRAVDFLLLLLLPKRQPLTFPAQRRRYASSPSIPWSKSPLSRTSCVSQVMVVMLQDRPFDAQTAASITTLNFNPWTVETVCELLRSIPRFFFQSARSIGRQKGFRHWTPLRQRNLRLESDNLRDDPEKVNLGLEKALHFNYWVECQFGFSHNESTCREMACVLSKGNRLKMLWNFLKEMAGKGNRQLVTTATITCLIKVLGEEGLANEALIAFYRMKQLHCKPDVYAYNTVICALCKQAKFLLEQMEMPALIVKHSMQTGCRKATRKRLSEANHLFRTMLPKGFAPDVVTYNCLIDCCCKTYRIGRALELFDDMIQRGCSPNRVTYNSFIRYYGKTNEIDKAIEILNRMKLMNHGIPTTSSYAPIIHALCEAGRVLEARDFLVEIVRRVNS